MEADSWIPTDSAWLSRMLFLMQQIITRREHLIPFLLNSCESLGAVTPIREYFTGRNGVLRQKRILVGYRVSRVITSSKKSHGGYACVIAQRSTFVRNIVGCLLRKTLGGKRTICIATVIYRGGCLLQFFGGSVTSTLSRMMFRGKRWALGVNIPIFGILVNSLRAQVRHPTGMHNMLYEKIRKPYNSPITVLQCR